MNNLEIKHQQRDRTLLVLADALILLSKYSDNYAVDNFTAKDPKDVKCEQDIKACIKELGDLPMVPTPSKFTPVSEEIINRIMSWKGLEIEFFNETGEKVSIRNQRTYDNIMLELSKRKFQGES